MLDPYSILLLWMPKPWEQPNLERTYNVVDAERTLWPIVGGKTMIRAQMIRVAAERAGIVQMPSIYSDRLELTEKGKRWVRQMARACRD